MREPLRGNMPKKAAVRFLVSSLSAVCQQWLTPQSRDPTKLTAHTKVSHSFGLAHPSQTEFVRRPNIVSNYVLGGRLCNINKGEIGGKDTRSSSNQQQYFLNPFP